MAPRVAARVAVRERRQCMVGWWAMGTRMGLGMRRGGVMGVAIGVVGLTMAVAWVGVVGGWRGKWCRWLRWTSQC